MEQRVEMTPQQQQDAMRALNVIDGLQQQYDDLEHCGENCQLRRTKLQNLRKGLQELLNRFSPTP